MSENPTPAPQAPSGDKPVRQAEFIKPPNTLKILTSAPGGLTAEEAIAAAQKRIEGMSADYLGWAREEFAAIERMVSGSVDTGAPIDLKALFQRVHDMKGQGGTFGYPLVTDVAHSFCRAIEVMMATGQMHVDLAKIHVDALKLILAHALKGPGGPGERKMVDGINQAREKFVKRVKVA